MKSFDDTYCEMRMWKCWAALIIDHFHLLAASYVTLVQWIGKQTFMELKQKKITLYKRCGKTILKDFTFFSNRKKNARKID